MARGEQQVNLRMPSDLKDMLTSEARNNNRSLTAEIVSRLAGANPKEQTTDTFAQTLTDEQRAQMDRYEGRAARTEALRLAVHVATAMQNTSSEKIILDMAREFATFIDGGRPH